ncbi:retroviral-like aspartic protease family protein [Candidatus Gottesmanbacteria bacterium]|nr:retroviral-like aspartic protease family protein [Candidatus Gottesmanbacteria bacterium]
MDVRFPFEDEGKTSFGHIYRPVAKVSLASPKVNIAVDIWMVVDTGADYTIIPRHFARKLRVSLESDCVKDTTVGVGGAQAIYFCKKRIAATVGPIKRNIPLAFFDTNETPALLGRLGFLETFDTEFLKSHMMVFKS